MKILLSLLLLLGAYSNYALSTTWVNFIPYFGDSECQSVMHGVGYSFAMGECFTLDYVKYWYFEAFDELTVQWDSYSANEANCETPEHETPYFAKNGECLQYIDNSFDLNFVPLGNGSYSVLISDTPVYPKFSYVNTFGYGTTCSHSSTTALFASFATNGTLLEPNSNPIWNPSTDDERAVFCDNNKATMYHCTPETNGNSTCSFVSTQQYCKQIKPFIYSTTSQPDYKYYTSTSCFGTL